MNRSLLNVKFFLFVSLMLSAVIFSSQQGIQAQTAAVELDWITQVVYPPTEDRGAPSRTTGSGTRGECSASMANSETDKLTALTPLNNISTTLDPHPTLYFYVPAVQHVQAELTLYNWTKRDRTPVYQTQLSLNSTQGIVKVTLPDTVKLQPNLTYAWNFSIYCDSNPTETAQYVDGWLERVILPHNKQAKLQQLQQQPLAVAQLYAEAGVWNETLEILSQMRLTYPQVWREFLASVELNHLEEYPVINSDDN
ncbi:MAG: DUF928 domain-containing protein [Microcoleaceae cyanobacterium]